MVNDQNEEREKHEEKEKHEERKKEKVEKPDVNKLKHHIKYIFTLYDIHSK